MRDFTLPSVTQGQHTFARVPSVEIQRSAFDRSCGVKTTFSSGQLVPIFADEALPGDTMNLQLSTFARMATPLHPFMDNLFMDFFFFAVPIRLIWDNWQRMMGEQRNPGDSTDYLVPVMDSGLGGYEELSLSDYLGIPVKRQVVHSSLWHRAYNFIWNEWFRDQNLQDSVVVDTDDGPDDPLDYTVLRRGKRHDYFTSCLPWPQKGEAVELPLGTSAPVFGDVTGKGDGQPTFDWDDVIGSKMQADTGLGGIEPVTSPSNVGLVTWNDPKLTLESAAYADLSSATAATINSIREAFQIQRLFERDARGGTRYTEILRSHFGVVSSDQRLQRPEFLGGGTARINVNPVAKTNSGTPPLASLAAFVTSHSNGNGFVKSFEEHCVVLGMVSVRADLNYQQGLPRMYSRRTRFDFYWPALANLGEQAVLNKEIYYQNLAADDEVFGYQERWAEYRYKPSMITGRFRSDATASLDTWHLAQEFEALPMLNEEFIEENPPVSRVIAVVSEPEFLFDGFFRFRHVRPMPTYSVPGLIDHF